MHVPGSRLGNYRTCWTFYCQSAVEKKNEKIAQNHIAVFSTRNHRFYHIFTCIFTVFAHAKDHILKLRTQALFLKRNF